METFSALLALWEVHRSSVDSPHNGQWRGALMCFFYPHLYKWVSKQSIRRGFVTPSRSLFRQCNGNVPSFESTRASYTWLSRKELQQPQRNTHCVLLCCVLCWFGMRWFIHILYGKLPLLWRHNGHDGVSNYQPHDCLLNRLFRRRSKKTSKLRVTCLCVGNSQVTGEFPAQRPVTREMFPFDDGIMLRIGQCQ